MLFYLLFSIVILRGKKYLTIYSTEIIKEEICSLEANFVIVLWKFEHINGKPVIWWNKYFYICIYKRSSWIFLFMFSQMKGRIAHYSKINITCLMQKQSFQTTSSIMDEIHMNTDFRPIKMTFKDYMRRLLSI